MLHQDDSPDYLNLDVPISAVAMMLMASGECWWEDLNPEHVGKTIYDIEEDALGNPSFAQFASEHNCESSGFIDNLYFDWDTYDLVIKVTCGYHLYWLYVSSASDQDFRIYTTDPIV